MSGTTKKVSRKINSPFFRPCLRGDDPTGDLCIDASMGITPPVWRSSAIPVSRKPHREQKLVACDILSCPHWGQNIGKAYFSSLLSNLVVWSVTLVGCRSLVSRHFPGRGAVYAEAGTDCCGGRAP